MLDEICITLRGRNADDVFNLWINVADNSLSRKWLNALNQLLINNYHLEKNYCWVGFTGTARNLEYLCTQINRSIHAINSSDLEYRIHDWFSPSNVVDWDGSVDHEHMNKLHRYFEDLQGWSGGISNYYNRADAETRWHIRQLNLLCHEFESWALSYRKEIEAPDANMKIIIKPPKIPVPKADRPPLSDARKAQMQKMNEARWAKQKQRKLEKAEAGAPKPTPTEKAVMPGKADLLKTVETGAMQAAKTSQTADAIDRVLTSAFTGFGAQTVLKVAQVANAFGLEVTGTSETEQLTQLLAQLAQGQAKTLPGALSEKELAFLREAIGTPGFTVTTLRNVVNRLRKDALSSEFENDEAQKFISGGGDLNRYDFVAARKRAQQRANQQIDEIGRAHV